MTALHVPVGRVSQGQTLNYECGSCFRTFSLMDRTYRGWHYYGVVVGMLLVPFGLWLARDELVAAFGLAGSGLVALLYCVVRLIIDSRMRGTTRLDS